jgi:putative nucleotidyltransferase with HDIG domain
MIAVETKEQAHNKAEEFTEHKSIVKALITAADAKDPYSVGHSERVRKYALLAAEILGLPSNERNVLEFGALLHDVGKLWIPDNILCKREPLTAEELYIIRKHCSKGADIVSDIPCLEKAKDLVLSHHERFDGKGYPRGLKGEQVPMGAYLIAVADAFDTMTIDHSYRQALDLEEAITELEGGAGTQFHPTAVNAFIKEEHLAAVDAVIAQIEHQKAEAAHLLDNE